jgi:UPF0716 protein FxsA
MPVRIMPLLFLLVPIVEIAVFIVVGGRIGLWPTLLLIVVTAIIGTMLLRQQGFGVLAQIRDDVNAGRVPAAAMAHGVMIIVAGVLLLTPGFVTDALGFLLFVPVFRDWVWRTIAPRFFDHLSGSWSRWPGSEGGGGFSTVIELGSTPPDHRNSGDDR